MNTTLTTSPEAIVNGKISMSECRARADHYIDEDGFFVQTDEEFEADCKGLFHDSSLMKLAPSCGKNCNSTICESIFSLLPELMMKNQMEMHLA